MGAETQNISGINAVDRDRISTALLILVLLSHNHPQCMSTYELGLWITDNRTPPRPLSVIVKNLVDDNYIVRAENAGKRAGKWCLTERGIDSLNNRPNERMLAERWLEMNPNYTHGETTVLLMLLKHGPQAPSHLGNTCSMLLSPVRTALKRLTIRTLVMRTRRLLTGYALTAKGRAEAELLALKIRNT